MNCMGCSVRATIDRYKKATADSSSAVSTSEANTQASINQYSSLFIKLCVKLTYLCIFNSTMCCYLFTLKKSSVMRNCKKFS